MRTFKDEKSGTSNPYDHSTGFKNLNEDKDISAFKTTTTYDNMKVAIRVRPPIPREIEEGLPFRSIALVSNDNKSCSLVEYLGAELEEKERQKDWVESPNLFQLHRFTFDNVFDMDSSQDDVYVQTAKPAVLSVLEGYNSTIFAYGQTGTGKTYTMEGFTYNSSSPQRGIVPRCIEEIFTYIESLSCSDTKFMVRASYLQIYNEYISDLLKPEKKSLQIREDKKKGVFVESLSEWAVRSPTDLYTLLQRGASCRATASTYMNDVSSRSHAVFVITVEQMTMVEDGKGESLSQIKVGKLNLVDLAGSERIRVSGATGKQLEESKKINKSLSALGNVIYALTDTKGRTHIPYRDSKLTRLLEDSLGGNCKTTMMAMISPAHESFNESLSSLHFAKRAKNIKNRPTINEDVDHRALIRQYETELKKLRAELDEKNRQLRNNELVIELEEQKKRAEQDKNAAIEALEQASRQYLQERDEKKRLEMKIQMMNSQMIIGGHKIEDTPQFRTALEERHTELLKEFDIKLQEVEKERQQIEEDKAQVERYKQLLLKQRDIMIALTSKLNERDETIAQLQEEVDAYDKINREQEEVIEMKGNRVVLLEGLLSNHSIKLPDNLNEKDKINRRNMNKVYIPYEAEKNFKEFENSPMTLMSSDEKIRELKRIIKDQEKEINVLQLVSQKFISSAYEDGKININEMLRKVDQDYERNNKIRELEEEKSSLVKEIEEKADTINFQRQEFDNLSEQFNQLEKNYEKIEDENSAMLKIKDELILVMDKIYTKIESLGLNDHVTTSLKNDVKTVYQIMRSETVCNTKQKESNSSESNKSNDEITNENNKSKNVSYTAHNYEKFKQRQMVNNTGKASPISRKTSKHSIAPQYNSSMKMKSITPTLQPKNGKNHNQMLGYNIQYVSVNKGEDQVNISSSNPPSRDQVITNHPQSEGLHSVSNPHRESNNTSHLLMNNFAYNTKLKRESNLPSKFIDCSK